MVSAFLNTVKIPELRRRILFTLAVVVIVRLGAAITTPGVNQAVLQEWFRTSLSQRTGGGLAALFNLFSGGALENCAVFSLGIMPYISASIMMQLLTAVIPQLGRLAREDGGRQKIMQLTRYTTVGLCIFQGYLLAVSFQHPESYHTMLPGITDTIRNLGIPLVDDLGWRFRIITVISLTTGTLLLMWLGDQITERGIGNGISLIITIGIVARLPAALAQAWKTFVPSGQTGSSQVNPMVLVLLVFLFLDRCHRCGDCDHARRAQDHCAVCEAGGGPENVRRPDTIHAVESELCGRDADHFCLGAASFSSDHCPVRI